MARPPSVDPDVALDHAVELLWTRGFAAVSVDDLVSQTALNRHSLYGRYGNKLGLLRAALVRYLDSVQQRVTAALAAGGNPLDSLQRLMALRDPSVEDALFATMLRRGCFAVRMAGELGETQPEIKELTDAQTRWIEAQVLHLVRDGQAAGLIRTDRSAEDLATVVCAGFFAPLISGGDASRNRAILSMLN